LLLGKVNERDSKSRNHKTYFIEDNERNPNRYHPPSSFFDLEQEESQLHALLINLDMPYLSQLSLTSINALVRY